MTHLERCDLDAHQARKITCERSLRLRIAEGDGGPGLAWDVVWAGIHLATLTDGIDLGGGRTSFFVVPCKTSIAQVAMLELDNFWMQFGIEFHEHESGMIALGAKALSFAASPERIFFTGLSFSYRLSFLDCVLLFFRSFRGRKAVPAPPPQS
jgi:hypothetical protein